MLCLFGFFAIDKHGLCVADSAYCAEEVNMIVISLQNSDTIFGIKKVCQILQASVYTHENMIHTFSL